MNPSHDPKATIPAQATPEALNSAVDTGMPLPDTRDGGKRLRHSHGSILDTPVCMHPATSTRSAY